MLLFFNAITLLMLLFFMSMSILLKRGQATAACVEGELQLKKLRLPIYQNKTGPGSREAQLF